MGDALDFRDPTVIDTLLSTNNYNVFFVCSHGSLADNTDGLFQPEPNTILIYTGAGGPGCPIWTDTDDERNFMNLYDKKNIKRTFAGLLGLYDGYTDLLYKVPTDTMRSPQINLSIDEEDIAEKTGFWGVYKHTGRDAGRREFSNIEILPKFTDILMEGTTASEIMALINKEYKSQGKTNIIMFISCRTALKDEARLSEYSDSASAFLTPSHFMLKYKPSGLNIHIPQEESKQKRIYLNYHDSLMPLDPEERNQTVKELLQYLRKKYGLFDMFDDVKTISMISHDNRTHTLQSEVLFESQWDNSFVKKMADGKNMIIIFPAFTEPTFESSLYKFNNNVEYYNPEHIESTVTRRRWAHLSSAKTAKTRKSIKTSKTSNTIHRRFRNTRRKSNRKRNSR
jgi:hypothetical protein